MSVSAPKLRALHYLYTEKRPGRVLAHCLNFDLVTAASDEDEAENRLDAIVKVYIERALAGGDYGALNTAAPEHFWEQFAEAFRAGRIRQSQRPVLKIKVPDGVVPMTDSHSTIAVLAASAAAAA